jgi:hypothetical protein
MMAKAARFGANSVMNSFPQRNHGAWAGFSVRK